LALANEGHKVTVIEMMDSFANGLSAMNRLAILDLMKAHDNITMLPNTKCKCISGNEVVCENKAGEEIRLPFDLVIAASGMRSENALAKKVLDEFPESYMIGDAIKHERIGDAVHQGFFTGMRI